MTNKERAEAIVKATYKFPSDGVEAIEAALNDAENRGLEMAADICDHAWNDTVFMVNQKSQSHRLRDLIRRLKK